jgi:hypothetical protein
VLAARGRASAATRPRRPVRAGLRGKGRTGTTRRTGESNSSTLTIKVEWFAPLVNT